MNGEKLLPLMTVAERTGTSVAFWRRQVSLRRIPTVHIGRLVRIREGDVEAWLRLGFHPAKIANQTEAGGR